MQCRHPKSSRKGRLVLLRYHKIGNKEHILPTHPLRLVVCVARPIMLQALADRDLWQPNILHDGPDDGQTRRLGREDINLIGAVSHIAKEAFNGVGGANRAMHDLWE